MTTRTFALRVLLVAVALIVVAVTTITALNYSEGDCEGGGGGLSWDDHHRSLARLGACVRG